MRLGLLKEKIVAFIDMMQYQYVWNKAQFKLVFNLEIAPCSSRPITGKIDEIMEKMEQDRYRMPYDLTLKNLMNQISLTRKKFRELDCEVLMHPPYSPDLAPSVTTICFGLYRILLIVWS